MKKKEIIALLQNYEEDTEVDLYIKIYDTTGCADYYVVVTAIEGIDREGIHASIV